MSLLAVAWYSEILIVAGGIATLGAASVVLARWGRGLGRAVGDLRRRRKRPRATGGSPAEPTEDQVRVLNAVHTYFVVNGRRARFRELDKQLDLEGVQLRLLAESMPAGLLLPVVAHRGGFFREEDELMVTLEGLRYCEHGGEAFDLLGRSLGYIAKRERPFVPSANEPELEVTSTELGAAVGLTTTQCEQVRLMLDEYEWQARTRVWLEPSGGSWGLAVAAEYVRRFRGVRDGDQYMRARAGESFAAQLGADEALPNFTLIVEVPSSPNLDAEPVVMRVQNNGPSDTFEATVVEITSADRPATPWHVRWRGSSEERKEILTGGHWVLEIARDDALHGAKDGTWTPGFVFLQPNDKDVFVAQTGLGSIDARYGVPMRVRIRVTPRTRPGRSLENVVSLHLSERGRQVLWDRHRVPA